MKNLFTLIAVLCCAHLFAQASFNLNPLNPTEAYGSGADDLKAENIISNSSGTNKTLRWERTIISLTADCEVQVCDLNLCYSASVSTKTFALNAGVSGPISVHLRPLDDFSASTVVRLKFYDVDNPADSLISIYTISSEITGTAEEAAAAQIKLFPNPTVESFTLDHADMIAAVRIFTLDGRQVARLTATPGQVYSLANQPGGTYIVVMENKQGNYLKSVEVHKQ